MFFMGTIINFSFISVAAACPLLSDSKSSVILWMFSFICDVMKKFNFKTLCWKVGAIKGDGYSVSEIITLLIMFPLMLLKSVHAGYKKALPTKKKKKQFKKECAKNSNGFKRRTESKKDKITGAVSRILLNTYTSRNFLRHHF